MHRMFDACPAGCDNLAFSSWIAQTQVALSTSFRHVQTRRNDVDAHSQPRAVVAPKEVESEFGHRDHRRVLCAQKTALHGDRACENAGAGSGIGREVALQYAARKCRLVLGQRMRFNTSLMSSACVLENRRHC